MSSPSGIDRPDSYDDVDGSGSSSRRNTEDGPVCTGGGGGVIGGGALIRMLTPGTLGRSLRGMKAKIDGTITTLKRGVSKEAGGPGAGESERAVIGGGHFCGVESVCYCLFLL